MPIFRLSEEKRIGWRQFTSGQCVIGYPSWRMSRLSKDSNRLSTVVFQWIQQMRFAETNQGQNHFVKPNVCTVILQMLASKGVRQSYWLVENYLFKLITHTDYLRGNGPALNSFPLRITGRMKVNRNRILYTVTRLRQELAYVCRSI